MSRRSTPLAPDLVVVLGGDEGAYETDRYPYLADEIALLARAHRRRGADLRRVPRRAAAREDARRRRVYKGERKEVGWLTVEPTEAGAASPVRHFAGVPDGAVARRHLRPARRRRAARRVGRSTRTRRSPRATGCSRCSSTPRSTTRSTRTGCDAWGDELPEYGLEPPSSCARSAPRTGRARRWHPLPCSASTSTGSSALGRERRSPTRRELSRPGIAAQPSGRAQRAAQRVVEEVEQQASGCLGLDARRTPRRGG